MSCDPQTLISQSACLNCTVPKGMEDSVMIYLLCQLSDKITTIGSQITSLDSRVTLLESEIGTVSGIPSGVIVQWSGTIATIPSGYHLCDGTNGTPDLRDKFVIAASVDNAGVASTTIRGAAAQTVGAVVANTQNAISQSVVDGGGGPPFAWGLPSVGYPCTATGNAFAHEPDYLPPAYALAYIMKL